MATVYMEQGKFEDALQNRSKAAQLDPLNARRHSNLADVLATLRRFDEEEQSINRAIALKPEVQSYYVDKIYCRMARFGDIDNVIPAIEEALRYCDTTEFILRNSSLTRYVPELPADSIIADFVEKQTADAPESSLFHGFSRIYLSHLDIIEGNEELARRQAENHSGDFIHWRGLLLSFAGECEEAIDCGMQAMELVETSECTP
jgi:tetratricopeptide (TPR) repeat protein